MISNKYDNLRRRIKAADITALQGIRELLQAKYQIRIRRSGKRKNQDPDLVAIRKMINDIKKRVHFIMKIY